jgi:tripartite-type tricarboxylate transporter receptor subunit TctC
VLPDIPTTAEAGHPDIAGDIWTAMLLPSGTPPEIATQLHRAIVSALGQPEVRERLTSLGYEPGGSSAEECAAQLRSETTKWASLIRDAGIRVQ